MKIWLQSKRHKVFVQLPYYAVAFIQLPVQHSKIQRIRKRGKVGRQAMDVAYASRIRSKRLSMPHAHGLPRTSTASTLNVPRLISQAPI
jgi:hypothetical protein